MNEPENTAFLLKVTNPPNMIFEEIKDQQAKIGTNSKTKRLLYLSSVANYVIKLKKSLQLNVRLIVINLFIMCVKLF